MMTLVRSETIVVAPYPRIAIAFDGQASYLSPAPRFTCTLTDIATHLRTKILAWLRAYADKKPIPWPLPTLAPSFTNSVLHYLPQIPWGTTQTYAQVAEAAGSPRAARAVGQACHYNPLPLFIPCHRVVATGGRLGGFGPGIDLKTELLRFEGVLI